MRQFWSKRNNSIIVLIILFFLLTGCAGYSITKNGTGVGYDVYKPEPYLLIPPQGDKSAEPKIIWLPNYSERYRITTWNFFSKADFSFNISDGWQLTSISDKSDNTALATTLGGVLAKAVKPETISLSGTPQLYKIVIDNNTGDVFLKLVPFKP